MKRDADFGKDTARPLKKSCDKFAGGGILAVPSPMTMNTHRSPAISSSFSLSSAEENLNDDFSSFLPRKKTPATVFQTFFHGRKLQRRFFKLSSMEENAKKIYSPKLDY
jgi:hypothetical protein